MLVELRGILLYVGHLSYSEHPDGRMEAMHARAGSAAGDRWLARTQHVMKEHGTHPR